MYLPRQYRDPWYVNSQSNEIKHVSLVENFLYSKTCGQDPPKKAISAKTTSSSF